MGCPYSTDSGTVAIKTQFGKFARVQEPGCDCLLLPCCYEGVAGKLSMRVQQHDVSCQTKTLDNVFINVKVSVQYMVKPGHEREAFYKLTNPRHQIESYVFDSLRAEVPKFTLDDVFVVKDKLSTAVRETVLSAMTDFGYEILATPITDLDPDAGVKSAMNETQRQKRLKKAAEDKGEAQKILTIKTAEAKAAEIRIEAEANADASELQGQGLSRQRQAIVEGLQKSVSLFTSNVAGTSSSDVMNLIMQTQYYDTIKDIGGATGSSTIFIPTGPQGNNDIQSQIRQGLLESSAAANRA